MQDWIDIEKLQLSTARPSDFVPRPSRTLMDQIRVHGPIEPVVVRPLDDGARFEILANAETWVAAGRAGLHKVPVAIRDDLDNEQIREIVEAHYGVANRNPIDQARYFEEQLAPYGGKRTRGAIGKLASVSGYSRPYIAHALRLLTLPEEIQDMLRYGKLTAGQARPLVSFSDRAGQIQFARQIVANRLTAREVEARVTAKKTVGFARSAIHQSGQVRKDPDTRRFERQVSDVIGCKFSLEQGRAVIDFGGDLGVLLGIVERMGFRGD